jgi:hypothetical protein
MINTNLTTTDSTSHALAVLTAHELDAVSGGGFTVEIPYSVGILINISAAAGLAGMVAASGPGGMAIGAGTVAQGLFDSWMESKMSNVRRAR